MSAAAPSAPLLQVQDLRVAFRARADDGTARRIEAVGRGDVGVSFDIAEHATVALVGESGSGKSVSAMSIVNLLPDNAERSGRIVWRGRELLSATPSATVAATPAELRALRGREIACVFQDPMSSLNPVFSVGDQVAEVLRRHLGLSRRAARARAEQLFAEVGLPEPKRRLDAYPHELSGGQQQRVMIAMALACEPKLLIADEPTTALDVTIQRQILELLARLKAAHRMSMLFISHDLGVVGEIADTVVVMRGGLVREHGPVAQVFAAPRNAYTQALLACRPTLQPQTARLRVIDAPAAPVSLVAPASSDEAGAPVLLEARGLGKSFLLRRGLFGRREFVAVRDLSFTLRRGRTLGVVGESGSGKSTLGLALLGLHSAASGPARGEILFDGRDLLTLNAAERQAMRRRLQIVFQNPYAALNPRFTVGQTLVEPMRIHRLGADAAEREARALALLRKVGLGGDALGKYPHEFSGGQRQRIAIARSLALEPELLVLDEAVSALDVSVQAQVLNLLKDLQDELGLAYVFISHDLAVVRFMADEVLVMKDGAVVERAPAADLLAHPREAYTRALLAAVPRGWQSAPA